MPQALKAVIFDMDGTITVPALDFAKIKAEIGLPQDKGILEGMACLDETARARAEEILLRHEFAAASGSALNDGVKEALAELAGLRLKTAILTNNCAESARIVLGKHGLRFDAVVSRDDCRPKPDPDGVRVAATRLELAAEACLVVGDYEWDIQAGRAAGSLTALYSPSGREFETKPDFRIGSLVELPEILKGLV